VTAAGAADFRGWTCHAPAERVARLSALVAQHVESRRVQRILDIGCGAGLQVRQLAAKFAAAVCIGVDISRQNIESAESARAQDPAAARMRFEQGDYLELTFPEPFDVIVSDGVLHLVDAPDEKLARRLATDLADEGTLVVVMASDCLYNRAFALLRRRLAGIRSAATDRAILALARLLYREMNEAMLSERVPYMYTAPTRLMGPAFRGVLAQHGLALVATHALQRSSVSQLKHAAYVFRHATGVRRT
jgi:trans-aconitate methyltransferase